MKRLTDAEWETLFANEYVRRAMFIRCEEEHHDYEDGLTAMFEPVRICRWCSNRKVRP